MDGDVGVFVGVGVGGSVSVFVIVDVDVNGVVGIDVEFVGVVDIASCRDRLRIRTQWLVDRFGFSVLGLRITCGIFGMATLPREIKSLATSDSVINLAT